MSARTQSSQPRELLFGHLSPPFLMDELDVLVDEVRKQEEAAAATRLSAQEPGEGSEVPPLAGVTGMSPFSSFIASMGGARPVLVLVIPPAPALRDRSGWATY